MTEQETKRPKILCRACEGRRRRWCTGCSAYINFQCMDRPGQPCPPCPACKGTGYEPAENLVKLG